MMKIVEYKDVDPIQVLHLSMLALGFPLTPEHAAHILQTDPRPFPCLAVYAVENDRVLGQVGIFRPPVISTEGRQDVGGVWAVAAHPQYAGRGIASRLLGEAHDRMRAAGLRFSTLGTHRDGVAHQLYRRHGYVDMQVWATAFTSWENAHQPTRLRAQPPGQAGYEFIEEVFENVARDYLGFAWRHTPFIRLRDKLDLEDIWVLWKNERPVGYALTRMEKSILNVHNLLLQVGADAAEAVAAVAARRKAAYVQVKISRPADIASLQGAGYRIAHPDWEAFMVKPLAAGLAVEDARQLFGIGTDRFLVSWLDVT